MALSSSVLAELAAALGIATEFWDWKGRLTEVTDQTVIAILAGMDVDASTTESAQAALDAYRLRPWTRLLPPCVVMEQGTARTVQLHLPDGEWVRLAVRLEEGGWRDAVQVADDEPPREVDGVLTGQASFELPADLPLGYHRLQATTEAGQNESTLVVSPAFLGFPASMGEKRAWGYASQLYSVTSADSWGIGDLLDLADLATWSATQQFASFVLVNPLHAAQPMPPLEPSPYLPTSRRYVNPLYIRPEAVPEYAELDERARTRIAQHKARLRTWPGHADRAGHHLDGQDRSLAGGPRARHAAGSTDGVQRLPAPGGSRAHPVRHLVGVGEQLRRRLARMARRAAPAVLARGRDLRRGTR